LTLRTALAPNVNAGAARAGRLTLRTGAFLHHPASAGDDGAETHRIAGVSAPRRAREAA
jgi:hypothetical protein